MCSFVWIKLKMADSSPFMFAQIDKMSENVVRMNISNTNKHFFPILYTCINNNPPINPVKSRPDQIHNGWLNTNFCLLKLTKYLKKLSVRMNISNTNAYFFPDTLHLHLLQSSHKSWEVSSGSNSKWLTNCHFCFLKLTKYLKTLSFRMNISNTNENVYLILYTCINCNPPMNPVKFRPHQI